MVPSVPISKSEIGLLAPMGKVLPNTLVKEVPPSVLRITPPALVPTYTPVALTTIF